ncbi:MAG: MarR family winged helix-turn-helix transcriptional regulator [Sciscionella sp.]
MGRLDVQTAERELVGQWHELLARHATVVAALDRALQKEHGLSVNEFEALERLADTEKCRCQDVTEAVHLSQRASSRVIARLEREGLVNRSMCDMDRRGIYVCLTDAGRERHAAARPTHRAVLAATLSDGALPSRRGTGPAMRAAP